MKKLPLISAVILLMVIMTACPYESSVPIDSPNTKFDKEFIGRWQKSADSKDFYLLSKKTDNMFSIEENTFSETDGYSKTLYYAHGSLVGDKKFLNIIKVEEGETTGKYMLYKYIFVNPYSLDLYPVSDYITEEFKSSAELKEFIKKYMDLSFFYSSKTNYMKIDK